MQTRNAASVTGDAAEATSGDADAVAIDEVQVRMQEALLLVQGLASNTCRALAAALAAAGVTDDDMLRAITTAEVTQVMHTLAVFKDESYPVFMPKNIGIKLRACAGAATTPSRSPASSRTTAVSQHAATPAAVAIDSIKPSARLGTDSSTSRPQLAKSEEFSYAHFKPYGPYEPRLMQIYEEVKGDWDMSKEAAGGLGCGIDPLVKQSLARHLIDNMGIAIYNTYVQPHLTKEERECPITIVWQLLSEARNVSEVDLSARYTALLQPKPATSIATLTTMYQRQVDEEAELRLHEFVTDKKSQSLKEALLQLSSNYPVLLTKIEIAWQAAKQHPATALDLVKAEVISFFSTQPAGPTHVPADKPKPAPHAPGPPRMLPTGRIMGSKAADNVCRQFQARGSCTYGSKCKYSHDKEAMVLLTEVLQDDEEDYVVEMFQQSTMAQAEPQIAMQVMQGIEGFDSP